MRCMLTWFHSLAEPMMMLSNRPLLPAGKREDEWGPEVDPSMTLHVLLGSRDRDNRFLSRFLKQQIIHPALGGGRDELTFSRSSFLSLWGGLPTPSSTALPSAMSRLGAATGGRVEATTARRGRTCCIASVCSCAARNCWAMLPV